MDETQKHYAEWKKPNVKGPVLYDSIHRGCLEWGDPWKKNADRWLSRGMGREEEREKCLKDKEVVGTLEWHVLELDKGVAQCYLLKYSSIWLKYSSPSHLQQRPDEVIVSCLAWPSPGCFGHLGASQSMGFLSCSISQINKMINFLCYKFYLNNSLGEFNMQSRLKTCTFTLMTRAREGRG